MQHIEIDHWCKFKFLSTLKHSPSYKRLAFVVSNTNLKEDKYESNIWVKEQDRTFQLTSFKQESSYIWLNDDTILFSSAREKKQDVKTLSTDFFEISLHGGEASKVFTLPLAVTYIESIGNKEFLVSGIIDIEHPDYFRYPTKKQEALVAKAKENEYVEIIEEIPFYSNGQQFIDNKRTRLFHYDQQKNKLTPITSKTFDVGFVKVNIEAGCAYVVGVSYRNVMPLYNQLFELDLKTLTFKQLTKGKNMITAIELLDNELVAFVNQQNKIGLNENVKLMRFNQETKNFELMVDPFYSIGNSINSDIRLGGSSLIQRKDGWLYFVMTVVDHSQLVRVNLQNQIEIVCDLDGSMDGFSWMNQQLYFIALKNQQAQELYNDKLEAVTFFNQEAFSDITISKPEKVNYQREGVDIDGWVIKPYDVDPTKSYPAILVIHGGPKTVYGTVYTHEMQLWASRGYFVMYTNPRGSDGKGNEYSDIRGKYGTIDYEDLMGFVDKVLQDYPVIDQKRLGVTGGSYGGFMTNWIIGHSNRFKTAITQRSISSWLSFHGVSDIGYYFTPDQNQATLYKDKDVAKLWWHSPIKYVDQMKTPTLIIHSKYDYRCPIDQAYQLFTALKEHHIDTKLVMFHQENHDLSRNGKPVARNRRYKEMLDWFDTYLKP